MSSEKSVNFSALYRDLGGYINVNDKRDVWKVIELVQVKLNKRRLFTGTFNENMDRFIDLIDSILIGRNTTPEEKEVALNAIPNFPDAKGQIERYRETNPLGDNLIIGDFIKDRAKHGVLKSLIEPELRKGLMAFDKLIDVMRMEMRNNLHASLNKNFSIHIDDPKYTNRDVNLQEIINFRRDIQKMMKEHGLDIAYREDYRRL